MKTDNSGFVFKGILLLICGVLFAFFPGVISWIFYIIGGAVIIGSAVTGLKSLGVEGGSLIPASVTGILIGLFIVYIPHFIASSMSLIAGIILAVISISQIVKALSKDLSKGIRILQLIFGIALLVCSIFLIFNPFKGGQVIRIIVGVVLIAYSAFNFYVAYVISERNSQYNTDSNIIDTNAYDVPNNDKHDLLQ